MNDLKQEVVDDVYSDLLQTITRLGPPQIESNCSGRQAVAEFIWYARNLQALLETYAEEQSKLRRVK